jgi:hypothetical protein
MGNEKGIDMMQVINDLAYPRLAGTENNEVKCKKYLVDKFKEIGFDPVEEAVPFSGFATKVLLRIVVAIIYGGLVLGLVLEYNNQALLNLIFIAALLTVALIAVSMQQSKTDSFITMGKVQQTFNLHVKIATKNQDPSATVKDILFVGHHDTKSQKVVTMVRMYSYVFGLVISLIMGFIFIISSIIKLFGVSSPLFPVLLVLIFAVSPFLCILLYNTTIEGKSLGALDNSTAIAIVFKLLEHYKANPDANFNLWFLLTGAEEFGMGGAIEYLRLHAKEKKELNPVETCVFNFDMVAGGVNYIEKFGLPKGKPYNLKINGLLEESAKELNIPISGFWLPMMGTTDGWIFKTYGCDTADIITRAMAKYTHSAKDTPEVCDLKTLEEAVKVTIKTVEKLGESGPLIL